MRIRTAKDSDAKAISSLVVNTAKTHLRKEFSDDGWELFQRLFSVKCQRELINNKHYHFLVAEQNNQLIGMLALKDVSHIFQLFVTSSWHNQGIASKLWMEYMQLIKTNKLKKDNFKIITVNASDYATDFYIKLGFKQIEKRRMKKGIYSTPLIYSL